MTDYSKPPIIADSVIQEMQERIAKLTRELNAHEARMLETYCEMFEERGLSHLTVQASPEPGVMRRTCVCTMFGKVLARVDVLYSIEEQSFSVVGFIGKD